MTRRSSQHIKSHDAAFAAFQERKRAAEATEVKVTWRRATWGEGLNEVKGHSGLGPDGLLLYVVKRAKHLGSYGTHTYYEYGVVTDGGERVEHGQRPQLGMAQREAERLALSR